MTNTYRHYSTIAALFAVISLLTGCGGTKVLKEPQPVELQQPLARAVDARVTATLDWVIVRDGPGTWARNADWDEYLLRVSNHSDHTLRIVELTVIDSLHTRVESRLGRKQLVKGSKATARRYRDSGLRVKAGRGAATMIVAGTAVTAVGLASTYAAAYGAILSGSSSIGTAGTAMSGLIFLGPALAVGGIIRGANNSAVNTEIENRQTILPLDVRPRQELSVDVFFPLAPSPLMLELVYADEAGRRHTVTIDTRAVLDGLHFDETVEQT